MTELDLLIEMILKHPDPKTGDFTVTIPKVLARLAATELAQIREKQKKETRADEKE